MFKKISHNRLKICQNVAQMLYGTPKTRRFSAFLSHFSKIIFEKGLFSTVSTVCISGWRAGVDSLWEQKKLEATLREMLDAKRAEEPHTSGARACWAVLLYSIGGLAVLSYSTISPVAWNVGK